MPAKALRAEEEWAQQVIERHLGVTVEQNDDNSAPGMFDLRVGTREEPLIAIEVTSAHSAFTETWNVGPAKGPKLWPLRGDWTIQVEVGAHFPRIDAELPPILAELEDAGFDGGVPVDHLLRRWNCDLWTALDALGVSYLTRYRVDGGGKVSLSMSGQGGAVDRTGRSLAQWVGDWIRTDRPDVPPKFEATAAAQRHVFIPVALQGAPWKVESYLTTWLGERQLPPEPPDLPPPVTAVWVVSTMAQHGVHWDGCAWSWFVARETAAAVH